MFALGEFEGWVAGDRGGLGSEEVVKVVPRRVDVEDVGAVYFRVFVPEGDEVFGVGGPVVEVDEVMVDGVEGNGLGLVEHAD